MRFFGLFWAKMTKIGIQNPKLIVTNDYQKFWAHFDWFLSFFQIFNVKPSCRVKNFFQDDFCPPIQVLHQKFEK